MMKKILLSLVCSFITLCVSAQNTFQLKTSGTDPQLLAVSYTHLTLPTKA